MGSWTPGTTVAKRYRLERLLGRGGMGEVWAASHTITGRRVALKFLHAALLARDQMRERFLAEARAATAVDHPAVIEVIDVFELDDGPPVIVMARLDGEPLSNALERRERLALNETLALLIPVARALVTAHAAGIVHRDLKPDNIFIARSDKRSFEPKILDFGIAKLLAPDERGVLTGTGMTLGTPCYMAPEQAFADKDLDERVDIWALGVVLYECLAGVRPVEVDSQGQLLKRLMNDAITPLQVLADVPEDLAALVGRMLEVERDDRPRDMADVADALELIAADVPPVDGWDFPDAAAEIATELAATVTSPDGTTQTAPMTDPPSPAPMTASPAPMTRPSSAAPHARAPRRRAIWLAALTAALACALLAAATFDVAETSAATEPVDISAATPPPIHDATTAATAEPSGAAIPSSTGAATSSVGAPAPTARPPAHPRASASASRPAWCNTRQGFEVLDDKGTLRPKKECL